MLKMKVTGKDPITGDTRCLSLPPRYKKKLDVDVDHDVSCVTKDEKERGRDT